MNSSAVSYGTSVTFTATAFLAGQPIPGPDTHVKFFLGGNEIARVPLNVQGVATYSVNLPAGQHSITAAYDAGISQQTVVGLSSPTTVTVNKALPFIGFDPITKVGRVIGQRNEVLTSQLTLRFSTNGGTTLTTTPPTSGGLATRSITRSPGMPTIRTLARSRWLAKLRGSLVNPIEPTTPVHHFLEEFAQRGSLVKT